jgi:hypothetical protein
MKEIWIEVKRSLRDQRGRPRNGFIQPKDKLLMCGKSFVKRQTIHDYINQGTLSLEDIKDQKTRNIIKNEKEYISSMDAIQPQSTNTNEM